MNYTTPKRITAIALLTALMVLGFAASGLLASKALAQSETTSAGSFGLDQAAQGGDTMVEKVDKTQSKVSGGSTTLQASPDTAEETPTTTEPAATEPNTTEPAPATGETQTTEVNTPVTGHESSTQDQPQTTSMTDQYQYQYLADTGGVPPVNPIVPGLILGSGAIVLISVNRRQIRNLLRHDAHGKDDDVFFG